jgi:hypothetical protein
LKQVLLLILIWTIGFQLLLAQEKQGQGLLAGNVVDAKNKALEGASVMLTKMGDSSQRRSALTDKEGGFRMSGISYGYYALTISYVGLQSQRIDSIHFRAERVDFNLPDIMLKASASETLEDVIIYAEKPLVQSNEGNLTFNASESAAAAGATASELLTQVPLVSKDADGKITVRGKEPKILIDDKPVELNLQQLQDLLESMPGSSIEKIEVMTNPPPQFANEQGGVINIVMRRGKVGKSARLSFSTGTRGETSVNANFNYRKNGLALAVNSSYAINRFEGNGYSIRNNIYRDSSNYFNTSSSSLNKSKRPNLRVNLDYELNKKNMFSLVFQYNQNEADNESITRFTNINRFDKVWRLSDRTVSTLVSSYNPSLNFSYTYRGKPGETLRVITNFSNSVSDNNREFYQQYLKPEDGSSTGSDSLQKQLTDNLSRSYTVRVNYDRMLANKKTFLSVGSYFSHTASHVVTDAYYKKKPEGTMEYLDLLSNDCWFYQDVTNWRASVKQVFGENFSFTAGTSLESTAISFDLLKENRKVKNDYPTWLPFANINKTWKDKFGVTLSYRRSINRPGMPQLNPIIDYSDPYNIRFGNPNLEASTSHHLNLVLSRTRKNYFLNLSGGYHIVEDVFSQVRTLLEQGKTQITWENISGRKEYELSSWNGFTVTKKLKVNASASMTYMKYSPYDINVRKFRNGASLTTTLGYNFVPSENWTFTGNFNLNRFANPQGYARWNSSLKIGIQRKFFNRKLIVTANTIDPIVNQQRRTFTYGTNFNLENYSLTRTRNYRISVAYNFGMKAPSKKPVKKPLK